MNEQDKTRLAAFFDMLDEMEGDQMMSMVDQFLDDDAIEMFVDHIEEFYGIEDDEELGTLAQIMVTGFMAAKAMEHSGKNLN